MRKTASRCGKQLSEDGGSSNTSRRPQSKLRRCRRRDSRTTSGADNSTRGDHLVANDPIDDKDQTPTTSNASNVPNDVNLIVQSRSDGHSKHGGDANYSLGDSMSTCSSVSRTSSVSSSSATSKLFSFFFGSGERTSHDYTRRKPKKKESGKTTRRSLS